MFENKTFNIFCELIDEYFNAKINKRNLCKLFAVRLVNPRLNAFNMNGCGFCSF